MLAISTDDVWAVSALPANHKRISFSFFLFFRGPCMISCVCAILSMSLCVPCCLYRLSTERRNQKYCPSLSLRIYVLHKCDHL